MAKPLDTSDEEITREDVFNFGGGPFTLANLHDILDRLNTHGKIAVIGVMKGSVREMEIGAYLAALATKCAEFKAGK